MKPLHATPFMPFLKVCLFLAALFHTSGVFAQPINDNCGGAIVIVPGTNPSSVSYSGSTTGAAPATTPIPDCANNPVQDVWFSFVATGPTYTALLTDITRTNPNADFYLLGIAAYSGTCAAPTLLACTEGYMYEGTTTGLRAEITLTGLNSGQVYYIQAWAGRALDLNNQPVSNDINFGLQLLPPSPPPVNDACSGAIVLTETTPVTGNSSWATDDTPAGSVICGDPQYGFSKGLWYQLTPTVSGNLTVSSCGTTFDSYLRVYTGNCSGFTACAGAEDEGCNIINASITFSAIAGTTYYILLAGYNPGSSTSNSGPFTLSAVGLPLKVAMGELNGRITDGYARLNWTTYNEDNNRGFEIQRSADGKLFEHTGFVQSKGANGSSTEAQTYDFTDPVAAEGQVFYRLKQTDFDQTTTYSNVISLEGDKPTFALTTTPNPATNKLTLTIRGRGERTGQLIVIDLSGKVCHSMTVNNDMTEIDLGMLASGVYLLKYADALDTHTIKIQKL